MCSSYPLFFLFWNLVFYFGIFLQPCILFSFCNLLPPSFHSGIQLFAPQTLRSKRSRVNTQLRLGIQILNIHFFLTIWWKYLQMCFLFYRKIWTWARMCENKKIYKRKLFCCTLPKHRHFCRIYSSFGREGVAVKLF